MGTVCGIGLLNVALADPSQHAADFDVVIDFIVPAATLLLLESVHRKVKAWSWDHGLR